MKVRGDLSFLTPAGRLLGAGAVFALFTGCSGGGGSAVAPTSMTANLPSMHVTAAGAPRRYASACSNSVIYIVSNYNSRVDIFDQGHVRGEPRTPCGSITNLAEPNGLFVDGAGGLWVALPYQQQVLRFAPGASSPGVTLTANGMPYGVAVDDHSGTVYVTDYKNTVSPDVKVEVYENGATTPTRTLSDSNAMRAEYAAVDRDGNLYVTIQTQANHGQVDEWIDGKGNPVDLGLENLIGADGIATTKSGALVVCDSYGGKCGEFDRGATKMTRVFAKHPIGGPDSVGPDKRNIEAPGQVALNAAGTRAYVADGYSGKIGIWRFPGPDRRALGKFHPDGNAFENVAVSPPASPGAPH